MCLNLTCITQTRSTLTYITRHVLSLDVLNYSHSRGRTQSPREPPNEGVCSRACTMSQYRTKLLLLSHKFSNVMINNTISNEAH
jgi:hypothetical protein